jgi:hypothetical protein
LQIAEQTAYQNCNIVGQYCNVARKSISGLTVIGAWLGIGLVLVKPRCFVTFCHSEASEITSSCHESVKDFHVRAFNSKRFPISKVRIVTVTKFAISICQ